MVADFVPGVVFVVVLGVFVGEATAFEPPELTTAELVLAVVFGGYVAGRFVRALSGSLERAVERIFKPEYDYAAIYEAAKERSVPAPHIDGSDDDRVEGFARRLAHEESDAYARQNSVYRYSRNILTVTVVYGFVFVVAPSVSEVGNIYGFSVFWIGVLLLLVSVFLLYRTRVLYHRRKRALEDGFYMGLQGMGRSRQDAEE